MHFEKLFATNFDVKDDRQQWITMNENSKTPECLVFFYLSFPCGGMKTALCVHFNIHPCNS